MNPFDEETMKLREEYEKKFGYSPPGLNYDEYNTIEDYKKKLKELLNKK